jgi:cytochrome c-type biogenesis protein CcmH
MANSGIFTGKPSELIKKALQLDPQNTMGLWLAGLVAYEEGEIKKAISYWQNVLPKLEEGSEEQKNIKKYIQFAGENNNIPVQENNLTSLEGKEYTLKLSIELSPDFNEVDEKEAVFIYAKAKDSLNNMPIIVLRKEVGDLPLIVELDDSMSMLPSNKLSDHQSVQIFARVSKSGNAKAERGDLIGVADSVSTTSKNTTKLIINTKVK